MTDETIPHRVPTSLKRRYLAHNVGHRVRVNARASSKMQLRGIVHCWRGIEQRCSAIFTFYLNRNFLEVKANWTQLTGRLNTFKFELEYWILLSIIDNALLLFIVDNNTIIVKNKLK